MTWRATCWADTEIAGNCLISYTLKTLLDYQQLRRQLLWIPCSQTTTFPLGRSSERGTAPLSSCDSNPTPTLHQQTWRIRTTPKVSTSEGSRLARCEWTRKDPGYEMDSQQKQIRQVAIILSFPPWCFLHLKLIFKWQHRTPPQTSIGLHARKSRLTVVANTTVKNGSDASNLHDFCQPQPFLFAACDDSLTHPTAELDERFIKGRDRWVQRRDSTRICCNFNRQIRPATMERDPKRNRSFFESGSGQLVW